MSVPLVWHEFSAQRLRRYHLAPKLMRLARSYLEKNETLLTALTTRLERARQLQKLGLVLIGEQLAAEKEFSHEVRQLLVACHHHHALIIKNDFSDLQHELLDAEAHLWALQSVLLGRHRHLLK